MSWKNKTKFESMDPLLRVGAMKYFKHNLVDKFDLNLKKCDENWISIGVKD